MTVLSVLRLIGWILLACAALIVAFFYIGYPSRSKTTTYGMTWSKTYADYLGIDVNAGLRAALTDFPEMKEVRIPAYWTEVEPTRGTWKWDWLDQQLKIVQKADAKVILAVGAKQPRWPECWVPTWAEQLSEKERQDARMTYVRAVLDRYGKHPAIVAWQVENEPDFAFGTCDHTPRDFIRHEIQTVKNRLAELHPSDRPPVYTTESGELSTWVGYAAVTDGVGISVYRTIYAPWGIFNYPLFPWYYDRHALLVKPWLKYVYVSEFQMEPWVKEDMLTSSMEEQFKTFSIERMKKNFVYAERIHLPSVHYWGVEWWYWMKIKNGHPEFWDEAKKILGGV
ncbi:MAG: beta-galactosidase [bacterium]|nr:beta-galactosidase [bacterium]